MTQKEIISNTIEFVKESLKNAEGGHDWFHIERVFNSALLISKEENADQLVVCLGALLHDIADAKFHDGDETLGPKRTRAFLKSLPLDKEIIDHVVAIVKHISFKNSLEKTKEVFNSTELQIVQDADRLDAIGAIGIARAFNYGGYKNRAMYNPAIPPLKKMSKEVYKKSKSPTINHFYEKLLLLKDRMNTTTGKQLAEERHRFMIGYLEQFYKEWEGAS